MRRNAADFIYTTQDHAAVASATKILLARYRRFVEYVDIQQELYLWLFLNYEKAERWRETYTVAHAERTLIAALRNAGDRYCRKEKAEKSGYHQEDEEFYSIPMLIDLLQIYFRDDWMMPGGQEFNYTTGGRPANEGGNLMAMIADVGKAYEALPMSDQALLRRIYGSGNVAQALAVEALDWNGTGGEISISAADGRIRRVVGRLRKNLGGPDPNRRDSAHQ